MGLSNHSCSGSYIREHVFSPNKKTIFFFYGYKLSHSHLATLSCRFLLWVLNVQVSLGERGGALGVPLVSPMKENGTSFRREMPYNVSHLKMWQSARVPPLRIQLYPWTGLHLSWKNLSLKLFYLICIIPRPMEYNQSIMAHFLLYSFKKIIMLNIL